MHNHNLVFDLIAYNGFNRRHTDYKPEIGMMVFNKDGKIFVFSSTYDKTTTWRMPKGIIRNSETSMEAAVRSLYEKANMEDITISCVSDKWRYSDFSQILVNKLQDDSYRGHRQKWLLLRFDGRDTSINIKKYHNEFDGWKWEDIHKVPNIATQYERPIYESVIEEFEDVIQENIRTQRSYESQFHLASS